MLYVHNETIKNPENLDHCKKVAREFVCLKDEDFFMNLNQRGKLKALQEAIGPDQTKLHLPDLKWRHGLTPGARNVTNVRHRIEPKYNKDEVAEVETILKSLIESGFAPNCDEELLSFDDDGKLQNIQQGKNENAAGYSEIN